MLSPSEATKTTTPTDAQRLAAELERRALNGGDVRSLLQLTESTTGRRAWHLSSTGEILCASTSGRAEATVLLPEESGSRDVAGSMTTDGSAIELTIDGVPARAVPLREVTRGFGILAVSDEPHRLPGRVSASAVDVLAMATLPMVIAISCADTARPAMEDLGTWLIHELQLASPGSDGSINAVAARLGVDLQQPFAAVMLSCHDASERMWRAALRWIDRPAAVAGSSALTILPGTGLEEALGRVALTLEDALGGLPVLAAAGPIVTSARPASRSFEHATVIHELLRAGDPSRRSLTARQLGIIRLLLDVPSWQLRGFADRWLGPLEEHPELIDTARAWLEARGNRGHVARRLHLHRNSVTYRLNRVSSILGANLSSPNDWTQIWCALEASRVLDARARLAVP